MRRAKILRTLRTYASSTRQTTLAVIQNSQTGSTLIRDRYAVLNTLTRRTLQQMLHDIV